MDYSMFGKTILRRSLYYRNLFLRQRRYLGSDSNRLSVPEVHITFSNERTLSISTGKYARFAHGSAVASIGETTVLATVVSKAKAGNNTFVPLTVDYRQKAAAAGRIPTNYFRRELGPSEKEILSSRMIDRSLRPLFPEGYYDDTHIVCNLLAVDGVNAPEVVAINAASAALSLSDVPWNGPIGAVRVGFINNEVLINPTRCEMEASTLNLMLAATKQNLIVMLDGSAKNILQQDFLKAIKQGTKEAQHIVASIEKLQKYYGKVKKEFEKPPVPNQNIVDSVTSMSAMRIKAILSDHTHDKTSRDVAVAEARTACLTALSNEDSFVVANVFNELLKSTFREGVLEDKVRCDGRNPDELRNISCQAGLYSPLHGSALFQRGQTQVLCTVALDSPDSALKLDTLSAITSGTKEKNFFLHYEFPSYATGEVGRSGGAAAGRREAGHGSLAERGLVPQIPSDLPFTVRLTAEVLESNGSSSMASVCGGSLALLDAGIALEAPAAGVAIGLISKPGETSAAPEQYCLLTDILGIEDYLGDMDLKVAGTKKGISAVQADIKLPGLPLRILAEGIIKACDAKNKILEIMNTCISKPRKDNADNLPVTEILEVEPSKRSKLLGYGGSNLKKLYLETGVQVTQEEEASFRMFAPSPEAMTEAKARMQALLDSHNEPVLEFGAIYKAKVVEVRDHGVMVILFPGMSPALLHNSQLDHRKIMHPSALGLEVGSEIQIKYFGRDPVSGQMRLSRKVLMALPTSHIRDLNK